LYFSVLNFFIDVVIVRACTIKLITAAIVAEACTIKLITAAIVDALHKARMLATSIHFNIFGHGWSLPERSSLQDSALMIGSWPCAKTLD
jgi:hypothetical protein